MSLKLPLLKAATGQLLNCPELPLESSYTYLSSSLPAPLWGTVTSYQPVTCLNLISHSLGIENQK